MALLFTTRAVRLFAYGFLSVVLVLYLSALGLSESRIGLLLTLTLLGDTAVSLVLTTRADRLGRRRTLVAGAAVLREDDDPDPARRYKMIYEFVPAFCQPRIEEFGTVTHRRRRIGEWDGEMARYSAMINGCTQAAITGIDRIDPDRILPVHTELKEWFTDRWENVEVVGDGGTLKL